MKTLFIVLWALAVAGSNLAMAQTGAKKPGQAKSEQASPKTKTEADDAKPDESSDAPADDEEKPAKKPGKGKNGAGIKLTTADDEELLKTLSYMTGYRQGHDLNRHFKELGIELDLEELLAAFKAGVEDEEPKMTEEEMRDKSAQVQKFVDEKYAAKRKEDAAKNKEEGDAYLAANKKKEGVKTLPSGLQYKVLKSGKGESPKKTDTVSAHYKGTFINGEVFDSSYKHGKPASFPVSRVIPGWTEALQLMKVGDKWQLFIPANLAYGPEGQPGAIPPNATLLFEVELLGVEKGGTKVPALR